MIKMNFSCGESTFSKYFDVMLKVGGYHFKKAEGGVKWNSPILRPPVRGKMETYERNIDKR